MRIVPPVEQEIRRVIRDERAKDPLIPITKLQENLERHFNREFSRQYLAKMSQKVARQTVVEVDRAKLEERLAFTRENYRMMREELMKVIYWSEDTAPEDQRPPRHQDRVEAAKAVAMLDLALLRTEIECGMYKKPIELIAKEFRYDPLPDDVRTIVIQSFNNFGILPPDIVQKMVPALNHAAGVS